MAGLGGSAMENSNIKVIDPLTKYRASITLIYNLKEKKDFKVYGEKDAKNCRRLDCHIHNVSKFLVQNELYFGCRIVVSGGSLVKVLPSKPIDFIYFKTINLYDNIVLINNTDKITPVALNMGVKASKYNYVNLNLV